MDVDQVVKLAEEKGWKVKVNGGGHRSLVGPEGQVVNVSSTPSDVWAGRHVAADLKRAGLNVVLEQDPVQHRGRAAALCRDHMRNHPSEVFDADKLMMIVRARYPQATIESVRAFFVDGAKRGTLKRMERGAYQWIGYEGESVEPKPAPVVAAPPAIPSDDELVEDMKILDDALTALSKIETVVRKHKKLAEQWNTLRKLMSTGGE